MESAVSRVCSRAGGHCLRLLWTVSNVHASLCGRRIVDGGDSYCRQLRDRLAMSAVQSSLFRQVVVSQLARQEVCTLWSSEGGES